ncbi:hypothetical protein CKO25_02005 [Thiocapsa imhoffii]|uniref:Uncharacterized protein n=2 Tax=Thiocapsa imhoffii TaxID=382777 RepID=A0A9X0WFQ6_9GAMM|nr:hypothetical protein [Thiocapsa imhoffii]
MRSPWLIPPAPETPPEWVAPGFGNPAPNTFYGDPSRGHRALSIARRVQPDAYLVEIRLRNIDPGVVRIEPWGHALRIGYQLQAQAGRGNGYPNAFSSSSASQTLRFPADAHLASMSREITADRINLRIPRIN